MLALSAASYAEAMDKEIWQLTTDFISKHMEALLAINAIMFDQPL
jgi:hypothetical protein